MVSFCFLLSEGYTRNPLFVRACVRSFVWERSGIACPGPVVELCTHMPSVMLGLDLRLG